LATDTVGVVPGYLPETKKQRVAKPGIHLFTRVFILIIILILIRHQNDEQDSVAAKGKKREQLPGKSHVIVLAVATFKQDVV
jgi:hypothetical protein